MFPRKARAAGMPMPLFLVLLMMGVWSTNPRDVSAADPAPKAAASVEGTWQGSITLPAAKLRLVLKIKRDGASGALSGTMDSIDQGARDLPINVLTFESGKLHLEMWAIDARYNAIMSEAGEEMSGTWTQGTSSLPLAFKRDAKVPVVLRPQEPVRPLPYREIEVTYDSAPGVKLAATLTLPQGKGPFPAVVLITGSGPQDRDESLSGHRPFYVLADYLTRRGIAVLRADDRGIGKSTGNFWATPSSEDFATDALAGVKFLAARDDIRRDRIGLVGHSEGGLVAPLAASRDDEAARRVSFLVLLAGPGVPLGDILVEQKRLILATQQVPADFIAADMAMQRRLIDIARTDSDTVHAATVMRTELANYIESLPEPARTQMKAQAEMQVQLMNSSWMRWMLAYDPAATLRRTKVPVLALFGSRDLQVPPAQNLPPVKAALDAAGNRQSQVLELPELNHLFQAASTGSPTEYSLIEETVNPKALQVVSEWIAARTGAQ